jgi:hypothetical protein
LKHISLGRKPSILEAWESSHCFPVRMSYFLKGMLSAFQDFQVTETFTLFNLHIQPNCRNTCISWKKTSYVRSRRVLHIVSLWELSYFLKRMLAASLGFHVEEASTLFKISLFTWIEETRISLVRKPCMVEAAVSCTLFPYDNWVSFWRLLPVSPDFQKEKHLLYSK